MNQNSACYNHMHCIPVIDWAVVMKPLRVELLWAPTSPNTTQPHIELVGLPAHPPAGRPPTLPTSRPLQAQPRTPCTPHQNHIRNTYMEQNQAMLSSSNTS
eukprot:GHRQ01020275.1.p1 GENE.GHRQ01020275.1~~GHRQ01020275.1.p1  ORF type:complete len:101 (+),score=5.51 GHRQ01020275.1:127-429(+)